MAFVHKSVDTETIFKSLLQVIELWEPRKTLE